MWALTFRSCHQRFSFDPHQHAKCLSIQFDEIYQESVSAIVLSHITIDFIILARDDKLVQLHATVNSFSSKDE